MDKNVLTIIITSSVIAACVTKIFDLLSGSITYKRDYYKRIIDQRLAAYQELNALLNTMTTTYLTIDDNRKYFSYFKGKKDFYETWDAIVSLNNNGFWYSADTLREIRKLIAILADGMRSIGLNRRMEEDDAKYKDLGLLVYSNLKVQKQNIFNCLNSDFKELHNVSKFLKNNKKKVMEW